MPNTLVIANRYLVVLANHLKLIIWYLSEVMVKIKKP